MRRVASIRKSGRQAAPVHHYGRLSASSRADKTARTTGDTMSFAFLRRAGAALALAALATAIAPAASAQS